MTNVLFFHPGRAPAHLEGRRPWRSNKLPHERAFLRARGRALHAADSRSEIYAGPMTFWGEWEASAESYALDAVAGKSLPTCVLEPRRPGTPDSLAEVHNTDPFVFGGPFLYSNCQQTWSTTLRGLERGDVIFFGSHLAGQFLLDTVFVVEQAFRYLPSRWDTRSFPKVCDAFKTATLAPLSVKVCDGQCEASPDAELTLYIGATPERSVNGMFSFVPARAARPEATAFARPALCKTRQTEGIDTKSDVTWQDAAQAVRAAELLYAFQFDEPEIPLR